MVYLPSHGHRVTLGSTRNIQSTTPNQYSHSEILGAVLISNDMARNRHHEWCVSRTLSSQKPLRQSQWGPTHWVSRWIGTCKADSLSQYNLKLSQVLNLLSLVVPYALLTIKSWDSKQNFRLTIRIKQVLLTHTQYKAAQFVTCWSWPCLA